MRRTKSEAGKTRRHILDTALILFDEQGYFATSLGDIAQSAGLTRGAIYWHFRNKSAIFAELGELYCGALFARIREAIASEQTWIGICHSFSEFFDGLEKNPRQQRFARILQIQCGRHSKDGPIKQLIVHYQDTWDALVREAIARAVATGELPAKLDQTWAFLLLSCTMAGVMSKYAGTRNSETIRRYAGAIIRATLALIEHGKAYPPIHCK